jgi:hypothetical protein
VRGLAAICAVVLAGCPEKGAEPALAPVGDAPAPPRKGPPLLQAEPVHAYPPHAIRSDGVGPYLLGMDIKRVFDELPGGPRLELLQLGRVVNWRVVRAEGSDLVICGDAKNQVGAVAVLGAGVARTTEGMGVGAPRAALEQALGKPVDADDVVRDRRIAVFEALPGVHFVTDAGPDVPPDKTKVAAVVVAREAVPAPAPPRPPSVCRTGGPLAGARAEVLQAARAKGPPVLDAWVRFGCVSAAAPEAIVVGGGELALIAGEPGKLRRLASVPAPGAELAGALDLDGDGKDEVVWVSQRRSEAEHAVELHVLRWEGGRLVELLAERPIVIGVDAAAAAGITPAQLDLALEVRAGGAGTLRLGGIYLARVGGRLREVAPLSPLTVRLEPRRSLASGASEAELGEPRDAPSADATARARDAPGP